MNKIVRIAKSTIALSIAVFILSTSLFAQQSQTDALKKAESEIKAKFGVIPMRLKALPDHMRASGWELLKSSNSSEAEIPAKYSLLIQLAVASQIPCDYCVYAVTKLAKMNGASEAEIKEAIHSAAETRYWSTIMNGLNPSFKEFKKETDAMFDYVKKQSKDK